MRQSRYTCTNRILSARSTLLRYPPHINRSPARLIMNFLLFLRWLGSRGPIFRLTSHGVSSLLHYWPPCWIALLLTCLITPCDLVCALGLETSSANHGSVVIWNEFYLLYYLYCCFCFRNYWHFNHDFWSHGNISTKQESKFVRSCYCLLQVLPWLCNMTLHQIILLEFFMLCEFFTKLFII